MEKNGIGDVNALTLIADTKRLHERCKQSNATCFEINDDYAAGRQAAADCVLTVIPNR